MEQSRAQTIWVDVEDFLAYFAQFPRPSGIQRVGFEMMRALLAEAGSDCVRFLRRSTLVTAGVYEIPWEEVESTFNRHRLADLHANDQPKHRQGIRRVIHSLPSSLRDPILRVRTLQLALRVRRTSRVGTATLNGVALKSGDYFLVLGSPWVVPGFAETLLALKHKHRLVTALLIYDLIPVRRPEWVGRENADVFGSFLEDCLPLFDRLMAISRHTAEDAARYASERSLRLAGPIRPIPIGTSFADEEPDDGAVRSEGLPRPGSYALVVSTIEPRKNHELVLRVWRQLLDEIQAGQREAKSVPELVFAGRVGTHMGDLLHQLESCGWLNGRVRLIRDPSDVELCRLYEGCLFTLVPSWFEGFGLSVGESLAMGKPCVASSATAIPEAGGELCRYFDPGDLPAAHRAISSLLDEPGTLAAWQDRVRREFRPTTWAQSAQAALAHLDA